MSNLFHLIMLCIVSFLSLGCVDAYAKLNGHSAELEVLIVSNDNRPMHRRLVDNNYVGISGDLLLYCAI